MQRQTEHSHKVAPDIEDEDGVLPPLLHVAEQRGQNLLLQLFGEVAQQVQVGGYGVLEEDSQIQSLSLELGNLALQQNQNSLVPHGHH